MSASVLDELLEEYKWLYRGVPAESSEVGEVAALGEVTSQRPERTGDLWRQNHTAGDTSTGYTSWTTERSVAEDAASAMCEQEELPGGIKILRVRVGSLKAEKLYWGRGDEFEVLIEGTVEDVSFSEDASTDEEDDDSSS